MNKKKLVLPFLAALCLSIPLSAEPDALKNPALNPVKIQTPGNHEDLVLVKDGKLNFAIVLDRNSESHIRYKDKQSLLEAERVLVDVIEKCTGMKPEVFDIVNAEQAKKYPVQILLGSNDLTKKLGVDVAKLPREGFLVKTFPGTVVIAGNDSYLCKEPLRGGHRKATLWGAYDFAERFFGYRCYLPGELGSIYPKVTNLTLKPMAYIDSPRFKTRNPCWAYWEAYGYESRKDPVPGVAKRLGNFTREDLYHFTNSWRLAQTDSFWAGHNPHQNALLAAYPDKKELIFFKSNSGHVYYNPNGEGGNYFNVVDLKFADLLIDSLHRCYNAGCKGPERCGWAMTHDVKTDEYICFGQRDSDVPLPEMMANPIVQRENLITPELQKSNCPYSDIYGRFFQYFATRLKQEFPDKKLALITYAAYAKPPSPKWKLPDNVELRVCAGRMPGWVRNPKIAEEEKQKLIDWHKNLGRPIYSMWLYNTCDHPFGNAICPQMIGDVAKLMGPYLGDGDLFFDQYGADYFSFYYANYAGSRAMWNPDFNTDAAIAEHWVPFYGPEAGPILKEFHQLLFDSYMKYHVPRMDREWNPVYPLTVVNKLEELLKAAKAKLKPGTVEMKRFENLAEPFYAEIKSQQSRHNYHKPVYGIHQLLSSEKIVVDGKMDDTWKNAAPIPMIDPKGSGREIKFQPDVRLAWDKTGIYGIMHCPWTPMADPKKDVWSNDSMEFFLSPGGKLEDKFHFTVDAMKQRYTGLQHMVPVVQPTNDQWVCEGFKYEVVRTDKEWTLEFYIPFSGMKQNTPNAYDTWFANMVCNKCSDPRDYSSSAMSLGNNHNMPMFGIFRFLGKGE